MITSSPLLYASNRAITWRGIGRFDAALKVDEQILPKLQRAFGEDHPFTLSSTANLASSLHGMGDHKGASARSQTLWERSRRVRGDGHPLTLACARNLALDLRATGDEKEGSGLAEQSMEQLADILGADNQVVKDLAAGQRYEFDIEPPQV